MRKRAPGRCAQPARPSTPTSTSPPSPCATAPASPPWAWARGRRGRARCARRCTWRCRPATATSTVRQSIRCPGGAGVRKKDGRMIDAARSRRAWALGGPPSRRCRSPPNHRPQPQNEDEVGEALQHALEGGFVQRSELYICSKVWCAELGRSAALCGWGPRRARQSRRHSGRWGAAARCTDAPPSGPVCRRNTDHAPARVRQACLKSIKVSGGGARCLLWPEWAYPHRQVHASLPPCCHTANAGPPARLSRPLPHPREHCLSSFAPKYLCFCECGFMSGGERRPRGD